MQGPGAGQAVLVCINRLRLLAIRAATAGPGGERNAFVSPAHLAAGRDRWKAKRALNEPRLSIIIKARPRNQSCYLPARTTGETLPSVAAKLGSEPTHGLPAQGTTVDVGQGCRQAPGTSWFNLQVQVSHLLQRRRAAAGWRETSGCQRSTVTSSPLFPPKALDAGSPSAVRKAVGFGSGSPNKRCKPSHSHAASSPPAASTGDAAELHPAVNRRRQQFGGSRAAWQQAFAQKLRAQAWGEERGSSGWRSPCPASQAILGASA